MYIIFIPIVVIMMIFGTVYWWRGIHPLKRYYMLNKIAKVETWLSINIDGNEYDIPEELESVVIDDYFIYLSDKDFFKRHCKRITDIEFDEMFDDDNFDEDGHYTENSTIWLKYRILFTDKSQWYIDFIWQGDGYPVYQGVSPYDEDTIASRFECEMRDIPWNTDHLDAMIDDIDNFQIKRIKPRWDRWWHINKLWGVSREL